jgi:glycosyltransferase involved in cell wall biosynthesis
MGYVFTSSSFKAQILRPVVRGLLKLAFGGYNSRVIVQNPDDFCALESARLVSRDSLRLIRGSGVDCRRFVFTLPPPVVPTEPFTFLLVARLLWDKGIREFVEAARLLHERGVLARFVLAGAPDEGNPAAIPEHNVHHWVAQGLVDWLGHVDDMPNLYANADVVVLPSHREGLPRTLIEAGAMARPLIATDAPGCREVVIHNQTGLLVPLKNALALADAMQQLFEDAALRQRLGAGARKHVLKNFEQDAVIAQTLAVYRELLPDLLT